MSRALLACALLLAAPAADAAGPPSFTVEGQLRPRGIASTDGEGEAGGEIVSTVTQRTRLGGRLTWGDLGLRVVSGQVRTLGVLPEPGAYGFHLPIALLAWSPGPLRLEVGRFQESLLQGRLINAGSWSQAGRSLDGARVAWREGSWAVEARVHRLGEEHGAPQGGILLSLAGGWHGAEWALHPLAIFDRDAERGRDRWTQGLSLEASGPGPWRGRAEGYLQGSREEGRVFVAGLIGGELTYAFPARFVPEVTLGYDLLSGDGRPGQGRARAFDHLYGSSFSYYGHLQVVTREVGGRADGQGLHDLVLKLHLAPWESGALGLHLHGFWAAVPTAEPFLGWEPDLFGQVDLHEALTLRGGGSLWMPPSAADRRVMIWTMLDLRFP